MKKHLSLILITLILSSLTSLSIQAKNKDRVPKPDKLKIRDASKGQIAWTLELTTGRYTLN